MVKICVRQDLGPETRHGEIQNGYISTYYMYRCKLLLNLSSASSSECLRRLAKLLIIN
jgi:hypothetical protein